jgi:hypothetical protein
VEVHILRESYIPGVGGGTVMSAGLMRAEEMRPDLTIVMSDGLTSDRAICFDIADRMSGKISALYFEPQDDVELRCLYEQAETFMRELARRGGTFQPCDLRMGARHLTHSLLDIVRVREVHHHRGEARHIHCGHQHHTIQRTASSVRIIRR